MTPQLDDWIAETPESIAARLDAAKSVQRQTHFTIGMLALVSMMMLIASYNAYLSFDSEWVLDRAKNRQVMDPKTVSNVLTERALADWAESRTVNISLIGIKVSVDDAPVLGTASLFVFSLWLVLLMRRENHTVGFLLRDTDTPSVDADEAIRSLEQGGFGSDRRPRHSSGQRWLIYHTIIADNLFVTFDQSLARVRFLEGPTPLTARNKNGRLPVVSRLALEFSRSFFFWFPVVASAAVFYLDRRSYFQPDPFLPEATVPGTSAPFFFESLVVFLACWIPLFVCCWRSDQYSRATESVLHEYGAKLRADLVRQQQLQG